VTVHLKGLGRLSSISTAKSVPVAGWALGWAQSDRCKRRFSEEQWQSVADRAPSVVVFAVRAFYLRSV